MVVDALSRKERLKMITISEELIREFEKLVINIKIIGEVIKSLFEISTQPELTEKIRQCQ